MKKVLGFFGNVASKFRRKADEIQKNTQKELEQIDKMDDVPAMKIKKQAQVLDAGTIMKFWFLGALVIYISYVTFQSLELIYLILAAFIISIAMETIIGFFSRKISRGFAIPIAYLLVLTFVILGFILIVPFVLNQTIEILDLLMQKITLFQNTLQTKGIDYFIENARFIPGYLKKIMIDYLSNPEVITLIQNTLQENISNFVSIGSKITSNVGGVVVDGITSVFSALFQIILVFVLAVFFSLEKDSVIKFLGSITESPIVTLKLEKLYKQLGFWLKGQLVLCLFIGITVFSLLYTLSFLGLDLPNKFTLSLIAGITEFIPILGPILGAVPALLVALLSYGFSGFVIIGFVYYIIQWTENNVLIPLVMNRALGISPLLIFIAMMIGGTVLGFVGVVLAVPLAVIVTLIFEKEVKGEKRK